MTWVDSAKWTCPNCHETCTCYGSPTDTRTALNAVQTAHYQRHRKAALIVARMDARAKRRAG